MIPTCTIAVTPTCRRYRLAADDATIRLVRSKPNTEDAVSLDVSRHSTIAEGLAACLAALLADFESDFAPFLARLEAAYGLWAKGRPGVRPHSGTARAQVEEVGNSLLRLVEGYGAAYSELQEATKREGVTLPPHEIPVWIQSGLNDKREGRAGRRFRLEEMAPGALTRP